MNIGEKILNMRKARGWSQEELADRVGVTRQAVSRWEAGSAKPDADKILAICDLFGVSADYLLRERYEGEVYVSGGYTEEKGKTGALTGKQILGFGLFALGLAALVVLEIICVIHPHTLYTDTRIYQGLAAYVRVYDLMWILWALWSMVGAGIVLMLWDWTTGLLSRLKARK